MHNKLKDLHTSFQEVSFNEYKVLGNSGSISKEQAAIKAEQEYEVFNTAVFYPLVPKNGKKR